MRRRGRVGGLLDDVGDAVGPIGCMVFTVIYIIAAVVFLKTCGC